MDSRVRYLEAASFCDLLAPSSLEHAKGVLDSVGCARVYLGSSFCCQYFLNNWDSAFVEMAEYCRVLQIPVTLVLPIVPQSCLGRLLESLDSLMGTYPDVIDEITCNDYALVSYCAQRYPGCGLNIGRLLSKDVREPRDPISQDVVRVPALTRIDLESLFGDANIVGIELDPVCRVLDLQYLPGNLVPSLYLDYCYVSTGNICIDASLQKDATQKFRPNAACACPCLGYATTAEGPSNVRYLRHGKTLFFEQPQAHIIEADDVRLVSSPLLAELFDGVQGGRAS